MLLLKITGCKVRSAATEEVDPEATVAEATAQEPAGSRAGRKREEKKKEETKWNDNIITNRDEDMAGC